MSEYVSYLHEASRALIIKSKADLTYEGQERLGRATAVLLLSASDKVQCHSRMFLDAIVAPSSNDPNFQGSDPNSLSSESSDQYAAFLFAMTEETLGEEMARIDPRKFC